MNSDLNTSSTINPFIHKDNAKAWLIGIVISTIAWIYVYSHLTNFSVLVLQLTGVEANSHLGAAISFFFYDTPKVILLLMGIVFFMGIIQSFFSPERTRHLLMGKKVGIGNTFAALLGIVTPFCSCSAVPLFIGFVSAGVPLGITFSFLIAAPMVNEIALVLLFGMFGWKIAALYLGLGLLVAIVAGFIIGKLNMENHLQDWVRELNQGTTSTQISDHYSWAQRFQLGWQHMSEIVGKVWPFIVIGILVGAIIHGYVPEDFMVSIMGKDAWWSVPAAVLMGVPMYTNAAGVIPIVEALIGKGAALGTTLAFMMSVIALSLPEMLILRKVLKFRLIATFIGIVAMGILIVGFIFNIIL